MAIKVKFDTSAVLNRLHKRLNKSNKELAIQVLKDSNYFCPASPAQTLMTSGKINDGGKSVVWDEVYATAQYYLDNNKSRDTNPNASYKWFERAKSERRKEWERLANDKYNK